MSAPDLVVIGGGIAGLTVARDAAAAGMSVTVVERHNDVGGMLRGAPLGEVSVDIGAESFATRTSGVVDLIEDADLHLETVAPSPGGAHLAARDGERTILAPLPGRAVLGIPGEPEAADVIRILGVAAAERVAAEREYGPLRGPEPTLAELIARRCGDVLLTRLVDPLCRSVFSRPASDAFLSQVHPALWRAFERTGSLVRAAAEIAPTTRTGSAVGGIAGGMWQLAAATAGAAENAGATIRTGTTVQGITSAGGRVSVHLPGEQIDAARVVLATGAHAAHALVGEEPPPAAAGVRVVAALVESSELDAHPVGSGVIVAPDVEGLAKALTHASAKWAWLSDALGPGRHVLRISLRDADAAVERAALAAELSRLTGTTITPEQVAATTDARWEEATTAGTISPEAAQAWSRRGIVVTGAAVAGTGLATVIPHARAVAASLLHATTPIDGIRS